MVALYITSLGKMGGKTVVGAGLGKHLLDEGKKVGFFKPFLAGEGSPPEGSIDSDVAFMKDVLALEESSDALCPVVNGRTESNL